MKDRLTLLADDTLGRLRSRLKARHLSLLLALQQHGSITRVAREWGVTQPNLTQALSEIEAMVGAPLFERNRAGVQATALGRLTLDRAARMLADMQEWANDIAATQLGMTARLELGVMHYLSGQLLCDTLSLTRDDLGPFVMAVQEASSVPLLEALREHRLEGVVARAWAGAPLHDLRCDILFHQRPALICHPQTHARLQGRALDWPALARMDWVLAPAGTPLGASVQNMFLSLGLVPPIPAVETHSLKVVGRMVERNPQMIALVPSDVAHDLSTRAGVSSLMCQLPWLLPPVALYRRQASPDSPTLACFVHHLRSLCRERFPEGSA